MASAVSRPTVRIVSASATVTTSSNSGNLKGTVGEIPMGSAVDLWLSCTNMGGGGVAANIALGVYLDISPDGGTTWLNAQKFANVTLSTGVQVIHFRPTGIGAVEAASQQWLQTSTGSVHVVSNSILPADQRIRWEPLADHTATATFAVFAVIQPVGAGPIG